MTSPDRRVSWRYTFCDLRSLDPLARLPLNSADFTETIGGPGDGSGEVPITADLVRAADPWAATTQRRTICFAQRVVSVEGTTVAAPALWAGIVWKRVRSGGALKLNMATVESYLGHRTPVARTFTAADDGAILRTLLTDAQTVTGGNLGIAVGAELTGTTTDLTVDPGTDDRTLLEVMQAVAAAAPCEWRIVPGWDPATGRFTLTLRVATRLGSTTKGALVWSSSAVGRPGDEVIGYEVTEDGTDVPNLLTAHTTASGDAPMLRSQATNGEVAAGWPLLEAHSKRDTQGITRQATLDRNTAAEFAELHRDEVQITSLTVAGDRGPAVDAYELGDTVTVRISDPLYPEPTQFAGRVAARRITPSAPGRAEVVAMTLTGT